MDQNPHDGLTASNKSINFLSLLLWILSYPRVRKVKSLSMWTGQGQTISPLLANIYLHYGLDGFEALAKPRLRVKRTRSVLPMMPYSASTVGKTHRR